VDERDQGSARSPPAPPASEHPKALPRRRAGERSGTVGDGRRRPLVGHRCRFAANRTALLCV